MGGSKCKDEAFIEGCTPLGTGVEEVERTGEDVQKSIIEHDEDASGKEQRWNWTAAGDEIPYRPSKQRMKYFRSRWTWCWYGDLNSTAVTYFGLGVLLLVGDTCPRQVDKGLLVQAHLF